MDRVEYGKWTILKFAVRRKGVDYYSCQCECGAVHTVSLKNMKRGGSTQCMACGKAASVKSRKAWHEDQWEKPE